MQKVRSLIDAAHDTVGATRLLDAKCRKAIAALRRTCPDAFATTPLGAGEVAPAVTVNAAQLRELYRIAFADAAGAHSDPKQVVWQDGESEILVRVAKTRVVARDGFALIGIAVYSEQTGDTEIVVSFAVGRPGAPLGLIMATEAQPRGPAPVVERWGEQLTAAAWLALVNVASGIAAVAGVDDQHQPLIPAALVADAKGITVTPQARHAIDRRER